MSGYLGLEGKRALVTGGTKGVGPAVVGKTLRPRTGRGQSRRTGLAKRRDFGA